MSSQISLTILSKPTAQRNLRKNGQDWNPGPRRFADEYAASLRYPDAEALAKLASEAKFDDFDPGSVFSQIDILGRE